MIGPIFSLLTNIFFSGLAVIGGCTVINKFGKFFMVIENEKKDGYKKGFDVIMVDSIDEINRCVESAGIISNTCGKIIVTVYDISMGNKVIRKNKEGKIIITEKTAVVNNYKNKLDVLNNKVKHYEEELKKMKNTKEKTKEKDTEDAENKDAENEDAENEDEDAEDEVSCNVSDEEELNENSDDVFYLENKED